MLSPDLIDSLFPDGPARPGALGGAVPAARPAAGGPGHPVRAQPHRLPAHWRGLRGDDRRRPGPPVRRHATCCGSRTPTRPGSPRAPSNSSRTGSTYFTISPDRGRPERALRPVRAVQPGRDLPQLRRASCSARDRAYLDFATKADLEDITARQRAAGALPGYYGKWAIWRDAPEEQVRAKLAAGEPYVVRFRSPGLSGGRVSFTDAIRGELSADDNRNDAVILKSSDQPLRLPTYHFAHAVDDHLMRISLVVRGDEWLSSVPLHLQLFDALGFDRIPYAHVAPLMKQDGGSRRKLSKRKDPEASVGYYIEQGYPAEAVQYYLRGLANGRLAEMPLPEALAAPIELSGFDAAGAAGRPGQAGRHQRRLHRHPARRRTSWARLPPGPRPTTPR